MDGEEIVSRSFPPEWSSVFYQKQGHKKKSLGGGRERSQWQPEAARGMPTFPPRAGAGARGGGNNGWGPPTTASCHPAVRDLLKSYISKFGDRIYLTLLLNRGGFDVGDLPKVRANMMGDRDNTCWAHAVGGCRRSNCGRVHVEPISDPLAQELCRLLRPGVTWSLTNAMEHERERQKVRGMSGGRRQGGPPAQQRGGGGRGGGGGGRDVRQWLF